MNFKKIKKLLAITIIFVMLIGNISPALVFAEEITPTPTESPSPTESPTPTDSPSPTTTPTQDPTPTPEEITSTPTPTSTPESTTDTEDIEDTDISPTPTPEAETDIDVDNSAYAENTASSSATTGGNTVTSTSDKGNEDSDNHDSENSSSSEDGNASIDTGDAVSVVDVENDINTTTIDAEFIVQTINIFVSQEGDLDLSNPSQLVSEIVTDNPEESIVNVSYVSVDNYAYLTNDVVSTANTGENIAEGQGYAAIETGDAYSMVSVLNKVNLVLVNSKIHILTINIFGDIGGNIVLPDQEGSSSECIDCDSDIEIENNASVDNNINSTADTGNNVVIASDSASITTGDAKSAVNNINFVNTNLIGGNFQALYINNLGTWKGSFLGWGESETTGEYRTICLSCIASLDIENSTEVINNISSTAETGSNSITGENGAIETGNAYSLVSVFNFINSSIIDTNGFFGFINIFGNWIGDVGGKSQFAVEEENSQEEQSNDTQSSDEPQVRSDKGLLTLTNTNNVGEYVYPGDTVTFSLEAYNPGEGMVYDSVIELLLVKDGEAMGGAVFKTGNIDAKKTIKVTTGLVLANNTPAGEYRAIATIRGYIGEDNHEITAVSESSFRVKNKYAALSASTDTEEDAPIAEVLGTQYPTTLSKGAANNSNLLLYLLMIDLFLFLDIKLFRERRKLMYLFSKELNFQTRLRVLRTFLF